MASILVVIELVEGRVHPGSLEVLGQARRLGTRLGASVYALLSCTSTAGQQADELLTALSCGGADKVLLAVSAAHAGAPRWGTHGASVMAAASAVQPLLLLLAETQGGRDLAARSAARLGAALLGDAWLEVDEGGDLALWQGAGPQASRLEPEMDFTVVATVPPGRYAEAAGDEEAEAEVLDLGQRALDFEAIDEQETGPRPIVIGEGAEAVRLAAALGGVALPASAIAPESLPVAVAISLKGEFGEARAERYVTLGAAESPALHNVYHVEGEAAALVAELTDAFTGDAAPANAQSPGPAKR